MIKTLFIRKKEVGSLKIGFKNPVSLSCEKVSRAPRTFNRSQITSAIENIEFQNNELDIPEQLIKPAEYILKDFFLLMHQTGLYNRQFSLWLALANITKLTFFKLQKGLFNPKDINAYIIEFYTNQKFPGLCAIIDEKPTFSNFKNYLAVTLRSSKLKGAFYIANIENNTALIKNLVSVTNYSDPILKYESRISSRKEVCLNLIDIKQEPGELNRYLFKLIYPEISQRIKEVKL